jgi:hypothetical protein
MGSGRHSGAVLLTRRMLMNREVGNPSCPQPTTILLGPVGSGKTHALDAIRQDLSWGVVHARFSFDRDEPVTTVDVLTEMAYQLSVKWRNRAKPQFIRFAIALIAVQADLPGENRDRDREQLRSLINNFQGMRWTRQLEDLVNNLADAARDTSLVEPAYAELFRRVFPRLIRGVRPRLGKALRSLADFPHADGTTPLDALVTLNRLAHGRAKDAKAVTDWLTAAFLGDVRENHRRMAKPEEGSPCACDNSERRKHWHNWVLLLDDVDNPGGVEFLADLASARDAYLAQHPSDHEAHDALLVVGTSGRWHREWNHAWLAPWKRPSAAPPTVRPVVKCQDASYDDWATLKGSALKSPYYPVMLDPQPISEIARILNVGALNSKVALVHRATGGLPKAVEQVAELLRGREVSDGARDVLTAGGEPEDPCYRRLTELGLTDHLDDVHIDDFVTAAPFATAPWLIPDAAQSRINQPHVSRILTELRTALWVTAKSSAGTTDDQAVLHPWIAANLVSALAGRKNGHGPTYTAQFTALRDDPDTDQDPVRRAYCQLALGDVGAVVTFFEREFNRIPHEEWLGKLDLVVHAPDDLPLGSRYGELYDGLVNLDKTWHPDGRTEIRNNVSRLIAAGWLTANPFAVRGQDQHKVIVNAFAALARTSDRPDVGDLVSAIDLARRGELP